MRFQELIKAYTKHLGIEETYNEDGSLDITFGSEIAVNFTFKGNKRLLMVALIDSEGKLSSEYNLHYLMRIQLSRAKTDDAVLSIDPDSDELVLYDAVDISDITVKQFDEKVNNFLSSVRFWRETAQASDESPDYNPMRFFP